MDVCNNPRVSECEVLRIPLQCSAQPEIVERARAKLARKHLHLIALNMANEPGAGFEVETNEVTLLTADTAEPLPLMSKRDVAERLLDAAERLL